MTTYRIGEAAELLGVSADTLRRWADAGRLPTVRSDLSAVTVGGRKVKAHRARDGRIRVSLRGAKKGVYTVRVRLTYTAHGRTATKSTTRHYRTCVRGAKKKKS